MLGGFLVQLDKNFQITLNTIDMSILTCHSCHGPTTNIFASYPTEQWQIEIPQLVQIAISYS